MGCHAPFSPKTHIRRAVGARAQARMFNDFSRKGLADGSDKAPMRERPAPTDQPRHWVRNCDKKRPALLPI